MLLEGPAPRDIRIKSDPENPTNVVIRWLAPNYSLITGKNCYHLDNFLIFSIKILKNLIHFFADTPKHITGIIIRCSDVF